MISKKLLLFIIIFIWSNSYSNNLPTELLDKSYIKQLDWKDSSAINNITNNWSSYDKDQDNSNYGLKDRRILKETNIIIDDISYYVTSRRFNESGNYEIVFVAGPGEYKASQKNLKYCDHLITKYSTSFSAPINIVNISDDTTREIATIDINAYWDVNHTRINIHCSAHKIYDGYIPLILIVYGHITDIKKVHNAVFIKCTGIKKGIGQFDKNNNISEEPPISLIIDQNTKTLKSNDINLGETKVYNDNEIITFFVDENNNIESTFRLDRFSGTYIWNIKKTAGKFSGSGFKQWGECTKIERTQKF